MSKIKSNPSTIKSCITEIRKSDISDTKKETIEKVLRQFTKDKQAGILTDGEIRTKISECAIDLRYSYSDKDTISEQLLMIAENMSKRNYFE